MKQIKIIEVSNCYSCPYAVSDLFSDRCGILKSDFNITNEHYQSIKPNCPLEDKK